MFFLPYGLTTKTQKSIIQNWTNIRKENQERERLSAQRNAVMKSFLARPTFSFKSLMVMNYLLKEEKKIDEKYKSKRVKP